MKRLGSLLIMGVMALSLLYFQTGCGGGSGASTSREGGPDASLTVSNAEQVGDTVTQAVKLVAPAAALGDLKTSSVSPEKRPPLLSILEKVLPVSGKSIQAKHMSGASVFNEDCAGGGSITVNITGVDILKELINADINVSSCTVGAQTLNGTMHVEYIVGSIDALTNPTLDNLKNFKKVTITTSDFTYVNTTNTDNVTLNDLTLVLQDFTYNGNVLTGGSITLGGVTTGTIDGEVVDIECDSFGLLFNTDPAGTAVSVSGRIKASCLGGWVTMVTNQSVFVPANAHCPTGGDIVVSAGGNAVTVHIAADFKITISFNGNVVKTFNSCSEVKGLCVKP